MIRSLLGSQRGKQFFVKGRSERRERNQIVNAYTGHAHLKGGKERTRSCLGNLSSSDGLSFE